MSFLKDRGKWRASANIDGRKVNLGTFSNVNDAIAGEEGGYKCLNTG